MSLSGPPRAARFGLALALLMVLAACAPMPTTPLPLDPPWADGEESRYDLLDGAGSTVGTATWTLRRAGTGWTLLESTSAEGSESRGEFTLDAGLQPLRTVREKAGRRVETRYGPRTIDVRTTRPGAAPITQAIPRPARAFDDDQVMIVHRALPLAAGYSARYTTVLPRRGTSLPVEVEVAGTDSVTVPAGTFDTWRVVVRTGVSAHTMWYAREAPRVLVRYRNEGSGSSLALRAFRASTSAPWVGNPTAPPTPARRAPRPRVNGPFLLASLLVQAPLMLLLPLALGIALHKRYRVGFRAYGFGAVTFVASQVVHLPLNWALGLVGTPRALGTLPPAQLAVALGLSAGLCEELARWVALRTALRDVRSRHQALQFGAGHGGCEAMILGAMVFLGLFNTLAVTLLPSILRGVPAAQAEQALAQAAAHWNHPWTAPVLAGFERVYVIAAHVGFAVLVTRAVTRQRVGYLLAAIAGHALLDAWVTWSALRFGTTVTELSGALVGFAVLAVALALPEPKPDRS